MKNFILINLALLIASTSALADTIKVGNISDIYVADRFIDSTVSIDFEQSFYPGTPLSSAELQALVTSDFRTSVKSPVSSLSFIDLGFTGSMYGGAGDDLVLFFVGNSTSFGLDIISTDNESIISGIFDITTSDAVYNDDGTWICLNGTDNICTNGYPLSAIFIDFGEAYDGTEISKIHLNFGNGFNGTGSSNFALAGGFHNTAVVPLPLPALLFSSGLAFLGWAGRRRNKA